MSCSAATAARVEGVLTGERRGSPPARLHLDGPQSVFNGPLFWGIAGLVTLGFAVYPAIGGAFVASNLAAFILNLPLALGLSLLWGSAY